MLRLLFALTISLGWIAAVTGQTAQDSMSPAQQQVEFLEELQTLMTNGKPKPVEEAYRSFIKVFSGGGFSPEEQTLIVNTGLTMRSLRLGATPHFQNYLEALVNIKQYAGQSSQFAEWQAVFKQMLADEANFRANSITSFLSFSRDFYAFNAIKYSPASISWFAFADNYTWSYNEEPILKVEQAILTALRSDDTLTITQANFTYLPLENELRGAGGKTNWQRTGLGSAVSVDLEQYTISTISSLYEAPVAYLTFPLYFGATKIKGSFSDKLVADDSRTTYPRFESDDKYINISNVGEGVRLRGGFRLHGSTVFAVGDKSWPAELLVLNKLNQPRYLGVGNLISVKDQGRIIGEDIRSVLYLAADSLFHPAANVRLNLSDLSLELSRGKKGTERYPFFHSLHQMNIDADFLKAYLNQDSLVIGRPTVSFVSKNDVTFESLDYFNQREYEQIQSIATANPLAIMKATAEKEGTNFIPASLLASRINSRFTVEGITPLIYDLVSKGFINYDPETQEVEMKDKIYHYVNADAGNVDYDFLRLVSQSDTVNATISLSNGYSLLNGVNKIEFSKTQRVAARPAAQQAYLRGDRNFDFDGRLFAGFAVFEGKDFRFKYQDFIVQMDSVRYFDLFIPTGAVDDNQQPIALSMDSRIEHLSGVLLVDAPNNKSGRKNIFIFPSLQSKTNSFVYYDKTTTQGGVYARDSFFFELQPFTFDHLDIFGPQDVKFKGRLFSNNMFPEINETLVLQEEDQSLGFSTKTPTAGFPTYDNKGTFSGELDLSNKGLLGKGRLDYLAAKINSDDLTFMPKLTTGSAEAFDLQEDREGPVPVPEVHGEQVNIEWRPYSDSLIVRSAEAPFEMFKQGDHQLDGSLVLTPASLRGAGKLGWSLAVANSPIFSFGPNDAQADTMNIQIKALEVDDRLALETSNVKGSLDFDKSIGHFEANDESVVTTLPYNQYLTTMNEFDWDMKGSTIKFESEEGQPALFTSIHPDQDSLRFRGKEATYNLKNSLLQIVGVDYIVTADALIYPDSQYVEIAPNAEMAILKNARIIADTINRYHVINRATFAVKGRRMYEASGFYEYNVGTHQQEFELQNIIGQPIGKGAYKDKLTATRATGEIEPADTFYIDNKTQLRGTISLDAGSKSLNFNGFARIVAENLPNKYWFTVSFEGDKNDLVINYDVPKSYDSEPLFTGLFLSKEFGTIYPRILTPLLFRKDRPMLSLSKGVFRYLKDKDQFVFGDSSVVVRNERVGNKMLFKNSDGSAEFEGKFTLGSELKYVSVDAAGRAFTTFPPPKPEEEAADSVDNKPNIMLADEPLVPVEPEPAPEVEKIEVTAEWMMGLKMPMPEALMKIVFNDFVSAAFEARPIGYLTDIAFFKKTVEELFPESKERRDALDGLALGFLDMPKRVNPYAFLFSKLPMKWHEDYQSFVSTSKENGLISINGESLNKTVECYVELKMPSAEKDDRLYVYLKSPSGLFYFFGFKSGILSITSNNTVFMQQLEGMKASELITKMPDGETYEIQAVDAG